MRARRILLTVSVVLSASSGHACILEAGLPSGLSTADPLTIPVLVAARGAAAEGLIGWFASRDEQTLRNNVQFLSFLPRVAAGGRLPASVQELTFSVLQAQSGYWTRYRVAEDGSLIVEAHHAGAAERETVIAIADSTLVAILRGRLDFEAARESGLILARGTSAGAALAALAEIVAVFASSPFGERVRAGPVPLLDPS